MNDWTTLFDDDNPIKTLNLKRLAARGTFFSRAYCASPGYNPSRVVLLTGLRPTTSGVYANPDHWANLLPDAVTLPKYFGNHGKLGGDHKDDPSFEEYFDKLDIRAPEENYNSYRKPENPKLSSTGFDWGEHHKKMIDVDMVEWVEDRLEEN